MMSDKGSKSLDRDTKLFQSSIVKLEAVELLGLLRFFNLSNEVKNEEDPVKIAETIMRMITKFKELNRVQRRNLLRVLKAAVK